MRIVIDMQGAQALGSRNRGIGRYSMAIARSLARNRGTHEIVLALNGAFAETIGSIRETFQDLLPADSIRVWCVPGAVSQDDPGNTWRRKAAELTYEAFLQSLRPDFIFITNLFEGLNDDAVTSIHALQHGAPVAVILYDLIPYIQSKPYLDNPVVKDWYMGKVDHLRRADLWLAISESARQEGVEHVQLPAQWSVNISTDADAWFEPQSVAPADEAALRARYGLHKPFVLYTGGIDHRKNVEGLIRAFAQLPAELRESHQLAIVCSVRPDSRELLETLAKQAGLAPGSVVLTGFVSDEELLAFYNLCRLFVFPSLHEGFGLPALEAMRCGAPVVASNTSSLPEVVGWPDALFDPASDAEIAATIARALTDESYRNQLIERQAVHAARFSWDESGRTAIAAMERRYDAWCAARQSARTEAGRRPRLAYVSPLPPARSGIADYSAELLPALAEFYDIEVVVDPETVEDAQSGPFEVRSPDWLLNHADEYDRVLYHFGNSTFHRYMFALLDAVPGVVVLHDFFLSGVIAVMDLHDWRPGMWSRALFDAHGYAAVRDRQRATDVAEVIRQYPCSLGVVQKSLGLIVHSANSRRLAQHWYGGDTAEWVEIPHMRDSRIELDRAAARASLGLGRDDFVVCAFGFLDLTKLNHRLLDAWAGSSLAGDAACHLVFVGENPPGEYGESIVAQVRRLERAANVRITGWADLDTYRRYLAAADIGVQLRTLSRGETSGTVIDCMNYGKATIVNANGSMADLDREAVWMLPDEFSDRELITALETLRADTALRLEVGARARQVILERHAPERCARQYWEAIEHFHEQASANAGTLAHAVARYAGKADPSDVRSLSMAVARSLIPRNQPRQLLVDVTDWPDAAQGGERAAAVRDLLRAWLSAPVPGVRIDLVRASDEHGFRYARRLAMALLAFEDPWLQDEAIDYAAGDVLVRLDAGSGITSARHQVYRSLQAQGVSVKFIVCDWSERTPLGSGADPRVTQDWLAAARESAGVTGISDEVCKAVSTWAERHAPGQAGGWIARNMNRDAAGAVSCADELLRWLRA